MTGTGTSADPCLITTAADLQLMENDLTAYYELAGNVDASGTSSWNSNAGFVPITAFTGQLDGKGYYIDQLFIDRIGSAYQGLIGQNTSGTIKNLGMTACNITGRLRYTDGEFTTWFNIDAARLDKGKTVITLVGRLGIEPDIVTFFTGVKR